MKKKNFNNVEILDAYEVEDEGFIDGDFTGGKTLATFSFGTSKDSQANTAATAPLVTNKAAAASPLSSLSFRVSQRGLTPAVDGELYTIKRCYQFRPSTIRKLNELKANHADFNVYLNTIIDEAISYYYQHAMAKKSN